MSFQVPPALASYANQERWLVWLFGKKKPDDEKPTKVPYQARDPKKMAKVNDPKTWATAAEAVAAAEAHKFSGIGLCLLGSNLAMFDVDDCRDPATGKLAFHRCQSCQVKEACRKWLDSMPCSVANAPNFCPSEDILFELAASRCARGRTC